MAHAAQAIRNNVDVKKRCPITVDRFNRDYLVLGGKAGNAYGYGNKLKQQDWIIKGDMVNG